MHGWLVTPREAIEIQRRLASLIEETPVASPVRRVAGVDCAFFDRGRQIVAAAVLLEAKSLHVLARSYAVGPVTMPYVPGLLSFREAPAELEALKRLPEMPDLLLVDGAGKAHPRRLGIASHVGLWLNIPTVGVAKSRLCGDHRAIGRKRGSCVQLKDGDERIGSVLRTRDGVKPLYISVGHLVTLREAERWTLRLGGGYRLPEPTRQADRMAGELKRALEECDGQDPASG